MNKIVSIEAEREGNTVAHPGPKPSSSASIRDHEAWTARYKEWCGWRLDLLDLRLTWTEGDSPKIIPNTANAAEFMRLHPLWYRVLSYDEFCRVDWLSSPVPGSREERHGFEERVVRDTDFAAAQEWFQKNGMARVSKQVITDAMCLVCRENPADPLRQYVERCADGWDGVKRIDHLFEDYFVPFEVNAYTRELGRVSMMTLVLRAHSPGAFQKMIPILEGPQDIGKSTGIAALCPNPDWFGDSLPAINNKDVSSYLRGKFLIEIAELTATRRADMDDLKSFISRSVEKYRPAYGRNEVEEPRRCMFWGTTNRDDYLRDETGSCRFYPVRVNQVNVEKIREDRDQLLAEALVDLKKALRNGDDWWQFSAAARHILEREREARGEDHPWTATILDFVKDRDEVAIPDILQSYDGLHLDKASCDRKHSNAVAGILKAHGWARDGKFTSGHWKGNSRYVQSPREGG